MHGHRRLLPAPQKYSTEVPKRPCLLSLHGSLIGVGKRAGALITPHMLWRFSALLSLRERMDVISLQRLLGHADISMTSHYVATFNEHPVAAHSKRDLGIWLEVIIPVNLVNSWPIMTVFS
jgi:integrase